MHLRAINAKTLLIAAVIAMLVLVGQGWLMLPALAARTPRSSRPRREPVSRKLRASLSTIQTEAG